MGVAKLYTVAETADILGVSARNVYRFMKQEKNPLRASRIGNVWRISGDDLQKFIDNGKNNPQAGEK